MSFIDANSILRKPLYYVDRIVTEAAVSVDPTLPENPYGDQLWNYQVGDRLYRSLLRSTTLQNVVSTAVVQSGRFLTKDLKGYLWPVIDDIRRAGDNIDLDTLYWSDNEGVHNFVFDNNIVGQVIFRSGETNSEGVLKEDEWDTMPQYDRSVEWLSPGEQTLHEIRFKGRVKPGGNDIILLENDPNHVVMEIEDGNGNKETFTNSMAGSNNNIWQSSDSGANHIVWNPTTLGPSETWKLTWNKTYIFDVYVDYIGGLELKRPGEQDGTISSNSNQSIEVTVDGADFTNNDVDGLHLDVTNVTNASAVYTAPFTTWILNDPLNGEITFAYSVPIEAAFGRGFGDAIYTNAMPHTPTKFLYQVTFKAQPDSLRDPTIITIVSGTVNRVPVQMIKLDPEDPSMGIWQGVVNTMGVDEIRVESLPIDGREYIEVFDIQLDSFNDIDISDVLNARSVDLKMTLKPQDKLLLDHVFDGKRLIYRFEPGVNRFRFDTFYIGEPSYLVRGDYSIHILYQTMKYLEFRNGDVNIVA